MTAPTRTIDDVAREAVALAAEATAGEWHRGHNPDGVDPLRYFADAYAHGPAGRIHLVCVPCDGKPLDEEALFVAITGNGPTSEANAALIAHAGTHLADLARAVLERGAAVEAVKREREKWRFAALRRWPFCRPCELEGRLTHATYEDEEGAHFYCDAHKDAAVDPMHGDIDEMLDADLIREAMAAAAKKGAVTK